MTTLGIIVYLMIGLTLAAGVAVPVLNPLDIDKDDYMEVGMSTIAIVLFWPIALAALLFCTAVFGLGFLITRFGQYLGSRF